MTKFEDLTGKTFGKLTIVKRAENYEGMAGDSRPQFECVCECGNKVIKPTRSIKKIGNRNACKPCMELAGNCNSKGIVYGRNANGFKVKTIIEKRAS